jgi:outer membrane cobalamin receptor
MEIKDIAATVERMEEVRGGNSIAQSNAVGGVVSAINVGGHGFNLSPVDVQSSVIQANETNQAAQIIDRDDYRSSLSLVGSQVNMDYGWGRFPF